MILLDILIVLFIISIVFKFSTRFKGLSFYINLICLTAITGSYHENIYGDYSNYKIYFDTITTMEKPKKELGFYYLNLFIRQFTDNFQLTFLIFTGILTFCVLKVIYRYSSHIEVSIFVYIIMGGYITATNIMRQMLALSLIFYGVTFLLDKKYIRYFLLCALAYTFHKSSLMPTVVIFLIYKNNELIYKNFIIYVILATTMVFFEPILSKFLTESVDDYAYVNTYYDYGSSSLHYIFQFGLILFYYICKREDFNDVTKLSINLTVIAFIFAILGTKMVLYGRISTYFKIFNILAVPNVIKKIDSIRQRRLYSYMIFLALMIYFSSLSRKGVAHLDNYLLEYLQSINLLK